MRDMTNGPQMDPFIISHCKDAREHQNHTLLGMVLVFREWGGSRHIKHTILACLTCLGREGRCRTAQTRPFWCVCAVQGWVCRYRDEGGARRGGRGIKTCQTHHIGVFDVSRREGRCRTPKTRCFGRVFGVRHERGHRTQRTCLPGCVLHVLEGAWL